WEKQKGSRGIRRGQWYRLVFQFPIRELAGLWLGMTSLAIKLGARPPLSDDEIKQRVERALDVFLRAYSLAPG
ncbi:TetR/AcrR family transcriptional regulator C-terminal domain-containing protein, partial [Klebsiella pneumoniae]